MSYELLGNPLKAYLSALFVFLAVLAAIFLARRLLLARLRSLAEKTSTDLDDFLVSLLGMIRAPEYFLLALYLASRNLALGEGFAKALGMTFVLILSLRAATLLLASADYALRKALGASSADASATGALQALRTGLHVIIWLGAGVFILDNLGIDISTVVAGLGIGGVAVALASQHILGDLFSSFVILMDKPFRVGDSIHLDDMVGVVEHIGIKPTRVRSLGGELLIFPNSLLTSARLRNYGQMRERRVLTRLGLVYQTPAEKLRAVAGILRGLLAREDIVRIDRIHFAGLGPSSLDFELVYFVLSPDYGVYMDVKERLGFAIIEAFEKQGLEFAYPTQTVRLAREPGG